MLTGVLLLNGIKTPVEKSQVPDQNTVIGTSAQVDLHTHGEHMHIPLASQV